MINCLRLDIKFATNGSVMSGEDGCSNVGGAMYETDPNRISHMISVENVGGPCTYTSYCNHFENNIRVINSSLATRHHT